MGKTALDLTPEERRAYQPSEAIRQRNLNQKAIIRKRKEKAWELARNAAEMLRNEYGAKRVVVIGSLAHQAWFTQWSDIDLVTWGISPLRFFAAAADLETLDASFQIDLLDAESVPTEILEEIEKEGIDL